MLFSIAQGTRDRNAGPEKTAGRKRSDRSLPPRGGAVEGRREQRFQGWVALQPLWITTLLLPSNYWVIYGSVPLAAGMVWLWQRRLLPSPTVIGMAAYPLITAVGIYLHVDISQNSQVFGPMAEHKIAVSVMMNLAYAAIQLKRVTPLAFSWCIRAIARAIAEYLPREERATIGDPSNGQDASVETAPERSNGSKPSPRSGAKRSSPTKRENRASSTAKKAGKDSTSTGSQLEDTPSEERTDEPVGVGARPGAAE